MAPGVMLPAWKRYTVKVLQPGSLKVLNDGTREAYEKHIKSFGNVVEKWHVFGDIDGYMPENTGAEASSFSLAPRYLMKLLS